MIVPPGVRDGDVLAGYGLEVHVRVRVRDRDTRVVRSAAAFGAGAATGLFVTLALAPDALAF